MTRKKLQCQRANCNSKIAQSRQTNIHDTVGKIAQQIIDIAISQTCKFPTCRKIAQEARQANGYNDHKVRSKFSTQASHDMISHVQISDMSENCTSKSRHNQLRRANFRHVGKLHKKHNKQQTVTSTKKLT